MCELTHIYKQLQLSGMIGMWVLHTFLLTATPLFLRISVKNTKCLRFLISEFYDIELLCFTLLQ